MITDEDRDIINKFKGIVDGFSSYRCDKNEIEKTLKKIDIHKKTMLTVVYNDIEFDFVLSLKGVLKNIKKTIVLGSGAVSRRGLSDDGYKELMYTPIFSRITWNIYDYNMIWYTDVSKKYYAKEGKVVSLGWNIGNSKCWFLEIISDILSTIFHYYSIGKNDILLYSSSGGGFQSIELGSMLKTDTVMVDCPQFDCTLHECFNILKKCEDDMSDIIDNHAYRYNVIECFKKYNYIPRIIINIPFSDGDMKQIITFMEYIKRELESGNQLFNLDVGHIRVNYIMSDAHAYLTKEEVDRYCKLILKR